MLRVACVLFVLYCAAKGAGCQDVPKPERLIQEDRSMEWLIAIERLRTLPRPGEIRNAGIVANIGDVVETTPDQKAVIAAALKAYDLAILQKGVQWENELKALRSEYEAKVITALPEARREAAKKALDYSHEQWVTPLDFEARLRADFLTRKEKADDKNASPEEIDASRKELGAWIKKQRGAAQEKNSLVVKNLKALLDPKEALRLSDFDKNKEVPQTAPKKK